MIRWQMAGFLTCLIAASPVALRRQDQASLPEPPRTDFSRCARGRILSVIDGDSVLVQLPDNKVGVRLIGVDAPEAAHPLKPVEPYGKEASAFLGNLLSGEEVWLEEEPASRLDKDGRFLYYIFRAPDGLFVNLEIVRQGYGRADSVYPFKHLAGFRQYERRAQEAGKGLWGVPAPTGTPPSTLPAVPAAETRPAPGDSKSDTLVVYVTRTGEKYHVAGCRYLSKSMVPIALKEARQRYTPCSVCKPQQ